MRAMSVLPGLLALLLSGAVAASGIEIIAGDELPALGPLN